MLTRQPTGSLKCPSLLLAVPEEAHGPLTPPRDQVEDGGTLIPDPGHHSGITCHLVQPNLYALHCCLSALLRSLMKIKSGTIKHILFGMVYGLFFLVLGE